MNAHPYRSRLLPLAGVLCALVLAAGCSGSRPAATPDTGGSTTTSGPFVSAEAQPIYDMIRAVQRSDENLIRTVFSREVIEGFREDGLGWNEVLDMYRDFLRESVGDFELRDFGFSYVGDSREGQVVIFHRGARKGDMEVVREGDAWKLNER